LQWDRRNPAFVTADIPYNSAMRARIWRDVMQTNMLKIEAELRNAVIDRLIAASLTDGQPAREATLQRWRALPVAEAKTGEARA
jgi:hypothetical protein